VVLVGDHPGGPRRDRPVVDGVGQVVAGRRGGEVDLQVQVDLEGLGPFPFLGQDAVDAEGPQPSQLDQLSLIDRARATSSRPGGPIWRELICSTMAMAWADEATIPVYTR
jgi:hypothetical protein